MPSTRPLRFITCGNVDDGKSTLIGRLLWDTKMVMSDQVDSLYKGGKRDNDGLHLPDFSRLLDGLQAEREQGITIDVAYRYFSTPKRSFIVADTPGHEQYTGNMATGASTADLAILLVDAQAGIQQQTRRHLMIASLMGIRQIVLVVNKMDMVGYDEAIFNEIEKGFSELLKEHDTITSHAIPIWATKGENIVNDGLEAMPWYRGANLLSILEDAKNRDETLFAFRMSVQRISWQGNMPRGVQGTVSGGPVHLGDEITILPSGEKAKIDRIMHFDGDREVATIGDAVTLVLDRDVDIARGDLVASATNQPLVGTSFEAKLVVLTKQSIEAGKRYWLKAGSRKQRVSIEALGLLDLKTQEWLEDDTLSQNAIAQVALRFEQAAVFDRYSQNRETGSFIIIDPETGNTIAGGMLTDAGYKAADYIPAETNERITFSVRRDVACELFSLEAVSHYLQDIDIVETSQR